MSDSKKRTFNDDSLKRKTQPQKTEKEEKIKNQLTQILKGKLTISALEFEDDDFDEEDEDLD